MQRLERIFRTLNENEVRYVLIGGLASILHGVPRTTVDIDIIIEPTEENISACVNCFKELGFDPEEERPKEILGMGGTTFCNDWSVDVLTDLPLPFTFQRVMDNSEKVIYKEVTISVISARDQIELLKSIARKKDLEDVEHLKDALKED